MSDIFYFFPRLCGAESRPPVQAIVFEGWEGVVGFTCRALRGSRNQQGAVSEA